MTDNLNLGDAISKAVAAKLDAAFVEKEVEARVARLVTDAVDSALRSYSKTGKLIQEKVEEALEVPGLDLPSYGQVVATMLKAQIEARVAELVAGRLAEDVDALLKLAPKTIKLSKIAEEMLKEHDNEAWGDLITVIVERSDYGGTWISLDEQTHYEDRQKYETRHRLLVSSNGTISALTVDKRDIKNTQHYGPIYGLAQRLRAYYAAQTIIEIDEDNVVIGRGDY
ncbi:hypothetical protein SAMN05216456_1346 [Devosia crocina]|uniref:Uncharacterized protein n=1 Tax=Devosia crocina TaxID=429728 RepID=A0A1I7N9W7_9HYPH|nr:hypothetical protein [Devosia crocina]SFV31455.1 hypothetical protein SAMN05216456_1346 [Devosia crocina]